MDELKKQLSGMRREVLEKGSHIIDGGQIKQDFERGLELIQDFTRIQGRGSTAILECLQVQGLGLRA